MSAGHPVLKTYCAYFCFKEVLFRKPAITKIAPQVFFLSCGCYVACAHIFEILCKWVQNQTLLLWGFDHCDVCVVFVKWKLRDNQQWIIRGMVVESVSVITYQPCLCIWTYTNEWTYMPLYDYYFMSWLHWSQY